MSTIWQWFVLAHLQQLSGLLCWPWVSKIVILSWCPCMLHLGSTRKLTPCGVNLWSMDYGSQFATKWGHLCHTLLHGFPTPCFLFPSSYSWSLRWCSSIKPMLQVLSYHDKNISNTWIYQNALGTILDGSTECNSVSSLGK